MILPKHLHTGEGRAALNNRGMALVTALMVLMTLTFMGAAAIRFTTTDIQISGNYKVSFQAFDNAEAGVQYAIAQIRDKFMAGTLKMVGNPVELHYAYALPISNYPLLPGGTFPFSNYTTTRLYLKSATDSTYSFQPTGYSSDSMTPLEVVVKIPISILSGVFADGKVDMKNNGLYNSYDSRITPNPTGAGDYTNKANVGSNTYVDIKNGRKVNGDLVLGLGYSPAPGYDIGNGSSVTGTTGLVVPKMNINPLGLNNSKFDYYQANNDNLKSTTAARRVNGNAIVGPKTLEPGNYYLETLSLSSGDQLTITGGEVNIYLRQTGKVNIQGNINSGGLPPNLSIYCSSTVTELEFDKSNIDFNGLLYAPWSKITFVKKGNVRGMLWGGAMEAKNNLDFLYDQALATKFSPVIATVVRWKELF